MTDAQLQEREYLYRRISELREENESLRKNGAYLYINGVFVEQVMSEFINEAKRKYEEG